MSLCKSALKMLSRRSFLAEGAAASIKLDGGDLKLERNMLGHYFTSGVRAAGQFVTAQKLRGICIIIR